MKPFLFPDGDVRTFEDAGGRQNAPEFVDHRIPPALGACGEKLADQVAAVLVDDGSRKAVRLGVNQAAGRRIDGGADQVPAQQGLADLFPEKRLVNGL